MPNFDGTGPNGEGPMTGCCRGYCILPISTPEQELDFLKSEAEAIKGQLEQIEARIRDLESEK